MNKNKYREHLLKQRLTLSEEATQKASQEISQMLIEYIKTNTFTHIAGYKSIQNEPNLDVFYNWLYEQNTPIFFPKAMGSTYKFVETIPTTSFVTGPFQVPEPEPITPTLEELDTTPQNTLILVPGIAFDKEGNRLGFGKGIYDQLLTGIPGHKIGIGYAFQEIETLPSDTHDIRMDRMILG